MNRKRAWGLAAAVLFMIFSFASQVSAGTIAFNHVGSFGDGSYPGERLRSAASVAVHPSGAVFVADLGADRIKRYTPGGEYVSSFYARSPGTVAMGVSNDIYVTDLEADRVVRYGLDGEVLAMWGGRGKGAGRFNWPSALAVDASGDVWVTDLVNSRLQRFDSSGFFKGAVGVRGAFYGYRFYSPAGIAVSDDGSVLLADTGNHRILRYVPSTQDAIGVTYDSAWGSRGAAAGRLFTPESLALDGHGRVYVADSGNSRVQLFTERGKYIVEIGRRGSGNGRFDYVAGVALTPGGDLLVADMDDDGNGRNDIIQRFAPVHRSSRLSLVSRMSTIGYGFPAALRATVRDILGRPVPGVPVTMQGRSGTPSPGRSGLSTGSAGAASIVFKPAHTGVYRASFKGANGLAATSSRNVSIAVRYSATLRASSSKVVSGKAVTFSGRLKPYKPYKRVLLQRYDGRAGKWRTVRKLSSRKTSTFKVKLSLKSAKKKRQAYRVLVMGDARNARSASRTVLVRIVPEAKPK